MTTKTANQKAGDLIRERVAFKGSNLSGHYVPLVWDCFKPVTGYLSDVYVAQLHRDQPSYIIYSYGTPIAWWSTATGWFIPEHKYSVSTSKHQTYVRRAIS
jgi:hypothetical protein